MWFFTENRKFVLKELDIDFLFFDLSFGHNFYCKNLSWGLMCTVSNKTESTLSDYFSKLIPRVYFVHEFEFLKIINVKSFFLDQWVLFRCLSSKIFTDVYFIWIVFFNHRGLRWNGLFLWLWFGLFQRVFDLLSRRKHATSLVWFSFEFIINMM